MNNVPTPERVYKTIVLESIEAIEIADWDATLPPDGAYLTHDWLQVGYATPGSRWAYVCVYEGDNLVGALPVSYAKYEMAPQYSTDSLAKVFNLKAGTWAVIGSRVGVHNVAGGVVTGTNASELNIRRALLEGAAEVAASWRCEAMIAPYVAELHRRDWEEIAHAQVAYVTNEAILDLPLGTFEDYLKMLTPVRASAVRREQKKFQAAGMTVAQREPSNSFARIFAPLACQVERKYGNDPTERGMERLLANWMNFCGERAVIWECTDASNRTAVVAFQYEFEQQLFARSIGRAYDIEHAFEYFNTLFYAPITYCLQQELRRLYLGIGSIPGKVDRGARTEPLSHILWTFPLKWSA